MELHQREFFIYQILSKYLKVKIDNQYIYIWHPTPEIQLEAQQIYIEHFTNALNDGICSDDDIKNILINSGKWSEQKEKELNEIVPNHIEYWKIELFRNLLKTNTQKRIRTHLIAAKNELIKLLNIRHAYDHMTAEGIGKFAKNQFIISVCSKMNNQTVNWLDVDINKVMFEYQKHSISNEAIRTLSHTTPWVNMWPAMKEADVLKNDLTYDKIQLITWSRLYDNIREHPDCPTDDVIDDDDMLDGWLILNRNKRKLEKEQGLSKQEGDEVFVMAETIEDARRIEQMNDMAASAIKKQRIQQIETQGTVSEANLYDVRKKLAMQAIQQQAKRR